jgi:hypothetical protein
MDLAAEARRLAALDAPAPTKEIAPMNDNTLPDPAIETLRERIRQYEADIAQQTQSMQVATRCRDELLDVIATLTRKSRGPRKKLQGPMSISSTSSEEAKGDTPVTLDGALVALGRAIATRDAANDEIVPEVAA